MYEVRFNSEKIGYVNDQKNINSYIEEITNSEQKENIAFAEINGKITTNLKLVSRDINTDEENIKNQIDKNINIEYTTYAITYNKKNIAYVSTMEDAENVIKNLEKENKDTKQIGILQVYSDNYDEIKAETLEDTAKKVSNAIKSTKKANTVKVAKANNKSSSKKSSSIFAVKPLSGVITSRYGHRSSPGGIGSTNHKGLDISAKQGTTIKASASGTVKFAGYKGSLGNLIIIDSGNGIETYYGHCSKLYVKKGQKVKAGDKIAAVGQTGAATGPHLHLEIHVNGSVINPQKYLYK